MSKTISLQSGSAPVRCLVSARLWLAGECETLCALTGMSVTRGAVLLMQAGGVLTGMAWAGPLGLAACCVCALAGVLLTAAGVCETAMREKGGAL